MSEQILVGVDIGTQGTKAVMVNQDGVCLAKAFVEAELHRPAPGVVEEDPERQVESVCRAVQLCAHNLGQAAERVAGIGIAGQMAGVIGIGRTGRHVTPYDSWLDVRCTPYIHRMLRQAGDEIVSKTGGPPSINHGPKILWWKGEREEIYRSICSFVQPGGYAAMRLSGLDGSKAFIDSSYLHFSGFADSAARRWDEDLCGRFGLDPSKLPRIACSHEVVGELTAEFAARCGLRTGVPIVAGCGDTAASFLSCGATLPGICVDVAGTASVFAATTNSFCSDREHRVLAWGTSAVPGLWHPYAYINGGGMNLEWFRRWIGKASGREVSFPELDDQAASVTVSSQDPLFIPHLGGRVSPSFPELRGAWLGLNWNQDLPQLYRAVLEGVALEYGLYRDALLNLNPDFQLSEIRITGGGEHSQVWNQIKADVLGVPVIQIASGEGAPYGAAMLAARGIGLITDLHRKAQEWIRKGARTEPNQELWGHYQQRKTRYSLALDHLQDWSVKCESMN